MIMEFRDLKRQYEELKTDIDKAISDVLLSSRFISSSCVDELEEQLAEYVGVKYCISCANGTDALTLALMAFQTGEGDAVFVPDFTFFASAESPAFLGAAPVFVDVESNTYNIDPDALERAICEVISDGRYSPKAVIAVDLFGQPANYDRIRPICEKYGLYLLEDGAQGFGGGIRGRRACSFGDISATSFFPAKPLGCYGDGGAVFTDNPEWAKLIRSYAIHGKNENNKYDNIRIGMNSRLDAIQAAVLDVKLRAFKEHELDDVNRASELYCERFLKCLGSEIILPEIKQGYISSWAQFTIQLPEGCDRKSVQDDSSSAGIPTMVYYRKPLHGQGAFLDTFSSVAYCPETEILCDKVLSLPIHPYISEREILFIVDSVCSSIEKHKK